MTTYCESIGLKVGDKIRFTGPDNHRQFKVGDVLVFEWDDGTSASLFSNQDNKREFFNVKTREWERVYNAPTLPEEWFIACGGLPEVRELMDRAGFTWADSDRSLPTEFLLNVQPLSVVNSRISWMGGVDFFLDHGIPEITYSQLKEYVNYHFPEPGREVMVVEVDGIEKKVYKDDYLKAISELKEVG